MQAHKLSSYNTELSNSNAATRARSCSERKVELVKGKTMLTSVIHEATHKKVSESISSVENAGQFDFAGLAG